MEEVNFDKVIDRHHTYSTQWDYAKDRFGTDNVLPFSISDTDFSVPTKVQEALKKRIEHPVYGYTRWNNPEYKGAIRDWYLNRFNTTINENTIAYTPSVVFAISIFIKLHSEPGDCVATFIPMYDAFFKTIESNDRILVPVKLGDVYNDYQIDWDGLETVLSQKKVKIFLLTNPHNPTGKVFKEDELKRIVELCERYGVFLISDDIHQDIVYTPNHYIPVINYIKKNVVLCSSGSKTFNTPGLIGAYIICPDKQDYDNYLIELKNKNALSSVSILGMYGQIAEYHSSNYVDDLLTYLSGNMKIVEDYLKDHKLGLEFKPPQGTYLAWINCEGLDPDEERIQDLLVNKGHVGIMKGSVYGDSRRLRMNIACPREKLVEGLERVNKALS